MGSVVEQPSARFLDGSVSVQVMVERTRGDVAKFAADIGYGACLVGHEVPGVAQLFGGHDTGAPTFASTCPCGLDALANALADDITFHLREGCLDLQKGPARRLGGVHRRIEGAESDAAMVQFIDQGDEFAGPAAQAVEVENDQDVALT